MARLFVLILTLVLFTCSESTDPSTENISFQVQPVQVDAKYGASEQAHYIVRNNVTHINKLLLFIGGSFSVPKNYELICQSAASIGLDVISLSYPNSVATAPLGTSSDRFIFDNYRDELCFGNSVSDEVSVDVFNCITTRATKLVLYLKNLYPEQNWGQYITSSNTLQWDKIILSGHSQGSGHACYIGKKILVNRVLMFSGPNDYSTYYGTAANWLTVSGHTPLTRHFSLLHVKDEIVPFNNQVANLKGLGLLSPDQNPIVVDDLMPPYFGSHSLSLSISALSFHSSTIGGNSRLPNVWTYMLTTE
ncbi:MAG: hypothetical protein HOP08_08165 [Cyclobacteriaceae bacterium]|nr:hypothetical protein [Cyclobacteriaceae bacterium]